MRTSANLSLSLSRRRVFSCFRNLQLWPRPDTDAFRRCSIAAATMAEGARFHACVPVGPVSRAGAQEVLILYWMEGIRSAQFNSLLCELMGSRGLSLAT
jgi:hypothetical protein